MSNLTKARQARDPRKRRGAVGELLAVRFLEREGMKILRRNYRFERGEIDIVAEEGEEIVFVEVKARRSKAFGEPEEAVTDHKQEQLRKVAEGYLFEHELSDRACRFDVVAIFFHNGRAEINHIRNAF